jgi:hypothetical protein
MSTDRMTCPVVVYFGAPLGSNVRTCANYSARVGLRCGYHETAPRDDYNLSLLDDLQKVLVKISIDVWWEHHSSMEDDELYARVAAKMTEACELRDWVVRREAVYEELETLKHEVDARVDRENAWFADFGLWGQWKHGGEHRGALKGWFRISQTIGLRKERVNFE